MKSEITTTTLFSDTRKLQYSDATASTFVYAAFSIYLR